MSGGEALHDSPAHCRNCGALAPGAYCPDCGQKTALHPHSARDFFHEVVGPYVGIEGKLWRTLALLAFRPGRLTTEYLQGRRQRYIVPLRLYLGASFLFFLIIKIAVPVTETPFKTDDARSPGLASPKEPGVKLNGSFSVTPDKPGEPPVVIAIPDDVLSQENGFRRCLSPDAHCSRIKTALVRSAVAFRDDPEHQRQRFLARLFDNVSYAVFAMLPVFALMMFIVYANRGMYYGEHMVFALHLHSFWFFAGLIVPLLPDDFGQWAVLLVFAYGVWAMRQVYQGRWWTTLLRASVISVIYSTLLGIATALFVFVLFIT